MPRVSVCTNREDEQRLGQRWSAENSNYDYCRKCYSHLRLKDIAEAEGVDEDAVCMEQDHPDYGDDDYTCDRCNKRLTRRDD